MAYTYGSGSFASTNALFDALKTALLAQGWTVLDTIATRDLVMRTADIDATWTGVYGIVRITSDGSSHITSFAYQDWDPGTHTGTTNKSPSSAGYVGGSGNYRLRVNPFSFVLATDQEGAIYGGYMRRLVQLNVTDGFTTLSAGASASATSLSVSNDMTGRLQVGMKVPLFNFGHSSASSNYNNCEWVTITSISSGSIGVSAITNAYDSGAVLGIGLLTGSGGGNGTLTPAGYFINGDGGFFRSYDLASTGTWNIFGDPMNRDGSAGQPVIENWYACANLTGNCFVANHGGPLGIAGHLVAILFPASGAPARYTKFTDGANVYEVVTSGAGQSPGYSAIAFGPTGDAVDYTTQKPLEIPLAPENDLLNVQTPPAPPATSAPDHGLNQGFN